MKIKPPKIEMIPIMDLKPWAKNPRKDHAVDKIADSIEAFGYQAPIIVQAGTMRVLAGHGRLLALKRLGAEEVPVIIADVDDQHADLYTFADNKLTELSGWDFTLMADTLLELDAQNLDLGLTGFDEDEIKRIMEWVPTDEREESDPTPPPPSNPITELGDIWELGRHRLLCGDTTKREDADRLMAGESGHMICIDPPYGVEYSGGTKVRDSLEGDEFPSLYEPALVVLRDCCDEATPVYLWHSDSKSAAVSAAVVAAVSAAGYERRCTIIWNKNQAQFGALGAQYKTKHESCLYLYRKGKSPRWHGPTNEVTVWDCDRAAANEYHPTQKPVALMERAIRNSSESGQIVVDGFCGSGSIIIAAEKLGRRCYAIEIEPKYVDVAIARWQNFTGKKARNLTREGVEIA